jgi:hypothetical protein
MNENMNTSLNRERATHAHGSPFIIFTLPRSRSAWLSHWLSYIKDGSRVKSVGHDSFSKCSSLEECFALFEGTLDGTVETGAAFAYPVLRNGLPKAKMLVVQRDPMDCLHSLMKKGITVDANDWSQRVRDLWTVSASGVRTIAYSDLDLESCARWIWEYCLEVPWDIQWWAQWSPINVQVDMQKRMEELRRDADNIVKLKLEIANAT